MLVFKRISDMNASYILVVVDSCLTSTSTLTLESLATNGFSLEITSLLSVCRELGSFHVSHETTRE